MTTKLIKFVFAYIAAMAAVVVAIAAPIIIFDPDMEDVFRRHGTLVSAIFGLTGMFVTLMYFKLQDIFIVFRPEAGTRPLSKQEIVERIEKAFSVPVDGKKLFDVARSGDKLIITWAASIDYFQITSTGGSGMKRVIVLSFDEAGHKAFFLMKDKDWKWNLSTEAGSFSLNYSVGIFSEYRLEAYPSIDFTEDGLKVDLKRLTYNSNDLWLPVEKAVLSGGWALHGGMIPKFSHRLLFSLPVALLFFGMGMFISMLATAPSAKTADTTTGTPAKIERPVAPADMTKQVEQALPHMKTEIIELQLQGIMRTQKQYITPDVRKAFVAFANGYLARKDRKDDFVLKIRAYAKENDIEGVKQ